MVVKVIGNTLFENSACQRHIIHDIQCELCTLKFEHMYKLTQLPFKENLDLPIGTSAVYLSADIRVKFRILVLGFVCFFLRD